MQYEINLNNVKTSAKNLGFYLKEKGFDVPRSTILEAFAKSLNFKNWNTLEGISTSPVKISHYQTKKEYLFELEAEIGRNDFITLLRQSFKEANANLTMTNFLNEKQKYSFVIDMKKSDQNIITAIFLLGQKLKPFNVKEFEFLRISYEKESLMAIFKSSSILNKKI